MFRNIQDRQWVAGWRAFSSQNEGMWHADGVSYRDRERLDVVVDGNTTLSPLIAARLGSN